MTDHEQHEAEFRSFTVAQRDSLRKYAYLLCGDWYEADDIVQKSLTKLFAAWRRIEPGGAAAYTRRIVTNTYLSHLRRSWVRQERTTTELPEPAVPDSPQEAIDTRLEVIAALAHLPARQRATIVLRYCEELTIEETADAMRCSVGTVKSQSSKAIQALRQLLPATPQPQYHGR